MPERAGAAAGRAGAERRFLAFDYGSRRVGVASGNTVLGRAQPLGTVKSWVRRALIALKDCLDRAGVASSEEG